MTAHGVACMADARKSIDARVFGASKRENHFDAE